MGDLNLDHALEPQSELADLRDQAADHVRDRRRGKVSPNSCHMLKGVPAVIANVTGSLAFELATGQVWQWVRLGSVESREVLPREIEVAALRWLLEER